MTNKFKFSNRLKWTLVGAGLSLALICGGLFIYQQSRYKLSVEEAKAIALKNAGLTAEQVTFIKVKKDMDDFYVTYDVEFNTSSGQYEYVIDAKTGQILELDVDAMTTAAPTVTPSSSSVAAPAASTSASAVSSEASSASEVTLTNSNSVTLSQDQAKAIVLMDAGLEEAVVTQLKIQLDKENGVQVYDVDFHHTPSGLEYDYKVDIQTGAIVEKRSEPIVD